MLNTIKFNNKQYPKFQTEGNASQFAIPYAKHVCKGNGFDIGCNKEEWSLPGSKPIDILFDDPWDAYNLPHKADYIYSSHCLEHLPDWVDALNYWTSILNDYGVLFLYLPDYSQEYWRPWNNRRHLHILTPRYIYDYLESTECYDFISTTGIDLNNSFMVMASRSAGKEFNYTKGQRGYKK